MLKSRIPVPQFLNSRQVVHYSSSFLALKGLQSVKVAIIASNAIYNDSTKMDYIKSSVNCHESKFIVKSWKSDLKINELSQLLLNLQDFGPDCIIAIGGGSLIDGAKLLWAFYEHPQLNHQIINGFIKIPPLRGKSNFIAVPTTIGTGSEVSSSAILYNENKVQNFQL